ncbi:MAG: hypothetical protein VB137_00745 [Burkholderia sp.]
MSHTISATGKPFGLQRVCQVLDFPRSMYRIGLFRQDFAIRRQVARAVPDGLRGMS